MNRSPLVRLGLFALLALLMTGTRVNHFGLLPDASWAVFFIAGFYFNKQMRWVFPALMVLAVAVDYAVISASGQNFWAHYCVSPGYWFLLPAHFSMWLGGTLLARYQAAVNLRGAGLTLGLAVASVVFCHGFAQGGFYWFSDSVANPSFAGWLKNYSDWLLPYMQTSLIYITLAAALHTLVITVAGVSREQDHGAH